MSYLVFARKWRPQNFGQVVGQEHISTTLKNALARNRVGHAYLFSGPRGTGKTSTARILAKALICEQGLRPSPCDNCANCQEVAQGRSLDVIEIDGASNRGIEQIRQLRENVKFAPAKSRFKIYIIDEVHQITTDGFNALLKTLEEPPEHVKFIFATTEAHKVLPTILSRCQRFDFKPLAVAQITQKLKKIIATEKLTVSEQALLYIARAANGSMRDAESVLDQLSSFCQGPVELGTVTAVLGLVDHQVLEQITQKIIERDAAQTLTLTEEIINQGKDLAQFIAGLSEHFRNILITKVVSAEAAPHLIDLPAERLEPIFEQGRRLNFAEIFYIFNVLGRAQENLRRALSPRTIIEMAMVKLTQRENLSSLEGILQRLNALEQNIKEHEDSDPTPVRARGKADIEPQDTGDGLRPEVPDENGSAPNAAAPQSNAGCTDEELKRLWPQVLAAIKAEKMFLASSLELARMVDVQYNTLTVTFAQIHSFYKENLEHEENKRLIEVKLKEMFQRNLKVKFILDSASAPAEQARPAAAKESAKETPPEPIIQSALKMFEGRIIRPNS